MRELATHVLGSGGYTVIAVEHGESVIETYGERKDEIDLVILDMVMPKLDGRETVRRLRAFDEDVRVPLSSGCDRIETPHESLDEGSAGFFGKPYRVAELLEKVEHAPGSR